MIRRITREFAGLAWTELAATICELLECRRPNGALKSRECYLGAFRRLGRHCRALGRIPAANGETRWGSPQKRAPLRQLTAQSDKQGAILDERFNNGGQVADYVIQAMSRPPASGARASILGPKVMIINEFAGSGGDCMPWMFHCNKVGTLVGKRTWAGWSGSAVIRR
jgi:hypothetical protein